MSRTAPDYYAVDRTHDRVLSGPETSESAALTAARSKTAKRGDAHVQIARVLPGTAVLAADYGKDAPHDPDDREWYVVRDRPALTGQDVTDPRVRVDRSTGAPAVVVGFTPAGQQAWRAATRRIAERGRARSGPGQAGPAAYPHVAIALDHRLLAVPYIDFRQHPHGLDPRDGMQIGGGLTPAGARTLVALLKSGALPVRLSRTTSQ
jgi:preprotein translocase subunit SecD